MPKKQKKLLKDERTDLLFKNMANLRSVFEQHTGVKSIMGIDPGRDKPGVAVDIARLGDSGRVPQAQTYSTRTKSTGFAKVIEVESWAHSLMTETNPMIIVMEDYSFGSEYGREKAGEMQGVIMRFIWLKGVPLLKAAPQQIKAFIGAVDKDHIMKDVLRKYKIDTKSSDEADAVVLAKIGQAIITIMNVSATIQDPAEQKKFEGSPHKHCGLTQKEARIALNVLIDKGQKAIEFANGVKMAKFNIETNG